MPPASSGQDAPQNAGSPPTMETANFRRLKRDRAWAEKKGVEPMARLAVYGIGAVEPGMSDSRIVPCPKVARCDRLASRYCGREWGNNGHGRIGSKPSLLTRTGP